MQRVKRARDAAVEAALAAGFVGVVEAVFVLVAYRDDFVLGAWSVIAALATLGALATTLVARALLVAAGALPPLARWGRDAMAGGGARTVAVWRGALAAGAIVGFGVASYRLVTWAHAVYRTRESAPFGLLVVYGTLAIAALVIIATVVLDHVVTPRLRGRALVDGSRFWIAVALAAGLVASGPAWLASQVAPAAPISAALLRSTAVVAVVLARMLRLGRRRTLQLGALAGVLAATAGIAALGSAEHARGLLATHGVHSRSLAERLWRLADGDGDGYAGGFGGADCDDGDAKRHPRARELVGNGVDENCTGADATLAERTPARAATGPHRNIVLVTVDALRADHLSAYGYRRRTSPALDAFAASAARFEHAFTRCPSTYCAIPTLHTGHHYEWPRIHEQPNLSRLTREAGFDTAAITCCERFATPIDERTHFETLDATADTVRTSRIGQSNADAVADRAIAWLRKPRTRPFFLWLHFYEPHDPYRPPDDAGFGDALVDRYDGEVAYADKHLGRVLATLDELQLAGSTIVVVTADHGEDLGEHGVYYHAHSLFEAAIRVPLLVRVPGASPRVIASPVSLADVAPTLLELAGLATPPGMNGRSFAPALAGGSLPARPVLLDLTPNNLVVHDMLGAVSPPWLVVWDLRANAWSLFRLGSTDEVSADEPAALAAMKRTLFELADRELAR